jgi:hypothetical protein
MDTSSILETLTPEQLSAVLDMVPDELCDTEEAAYAEWARQLEAIFGSAWPEMVDKPQSQGWPGSALRRAYDHLQACKAAVMGATAAAVRRSTMRAIHSTH